MAIESSAGAVAGVIHDRGYQRYAGQRRGRREIVAALCWHSLRGAFGIGRGAKAKIVPVIAFLVMCLPAAINAVSVDGGGAPVVSYGTYTFALRVVVMIVFVAVQAPELVSRDLRSRVLPLYFSRPMRRGDYPVAKYLAFTLACLIMIEIPLLLLYLGNVVSAKNGTAVWDQTKGVAGGLAVGVAWAVLLAAIGLALASLSPRRAYATGTIAIFFFLTFTLAGIIYKVEGGMGHVLAGGGAQRGQVVGGHFVARPLPAPPTPRLAGLISPFSVIDGVRQWLGGVAPGPFGAPGSDGPLYGLMFLLLLAASLAIFAARYRKAGAE